MHGPSCSTGLIAVCLCGIHVPGFDGPALGPDATRGPAVSESDLYPSRELGGNLGVPLRWTACSTCRDPDPPRGPDEDYLEALRRRWTPPRTRGLSPAPARHPERGRRQPARRVRHAAPVLAVVARRFAGAPTVLFDLLRGPLSVAPGTAERPGTDPVVVRQMRTILLALLGELRAEHPAAIVLAEAVAGTTGGGPLTYTDGSLAPGVLAGYRTAPIP